MFDCMIIRCVNCGEDIDIAEWQRPLSYAIREAGWSGPLRMFVVIGRGWLLHRCAVDTAFEMTVPVDANRWAEPNR